MAKPSNDPMMVLPKIVQKLTTIRLQEAKVLQHLAGTALGADMSPLKKSLLKSVASGNLRQPDLPSKSRKLILLSNL